MIYGDGYKFISLRDVHGAVGRASGCNHEAGRFDP